MPEQSDLVACLTRRMLQLNTYQQTDKLLSLRERARAFHSSDFRNRIKIDEILLVASP